MCGRYHKLLSRRHHGYLPAVQLLDTLQRIMVIYLATLSARQIKPGETWFIVSANADESAEARELCDTLRCLCQR